jgi:hypothetical protein
MMSLDDAAPVVEANRHATAVAGRGVEDLIALDWSFDTSTTRDLTHDLHPWPAKFIPDIPAAAIAAFTAPGDTVLDPFCGCGTTAVEALRSQRSVVSTDLNPLAVLITEAKSTVLSARTIRRVQEWSENLRVVDELDAVEHVPAIPNIDYWFDADVIAQLANLRAKILDFGEASPLLNVVFSSIIVGVSHQESETRYRRVDKTVTAGDVLKRFRQKLAAALAMIRNLGDEVAGTLATSRSLVSDARSLATTIEDAKADLAVFSPPYPNAFDYHLYHRFRMFWLGMDPRTVKPDEIGAHLNYGTGAGWRADMTQAFKGITAFVRPGGHVVCVVGDGFIKGEVYPSGDALWEAGEEVGLTQEWRTVRPVSRSRRSFNLSDSRLREEHVLVFQR